jgi:hypothetical protein
MFEQGDLPARSARSTPKWRVPQGGGHVPQGRPGRQGRRGVRAGVQRGKDGDQRIVASREQEERVLGFAAQESCSRKRAGSTRPARCSKRARRSTGPRRPTSRGQPEKRLRLT